MVLPAWAWPAFSGALIVLLAVDLIAFHRKAHVPSTRGTLLLTALWAAIAFTFGVALTIHYGSDIGLSFTAGYLMEWALAVDNVFVFVAVFAQFRIPPGPPGLRAVLRDYRGYCAAWLVHCRRFGA